MTAAWTVATGAAHCVARPQKIARAVNRASSTSIISGLKSVKYKKVKQSKCYSQESVKVRGVTRQRASPVAEYEGQGGRCGYIFSEIKK